MIVLVLLLLPFAHGDVFPSFPSCDTGLPSGKDHPGALMMNTSEFTSSIARARVTYRQARRHGVWYPTPCTGDHRLWLTESMKWSEHAYAFQTPFDSGWVIGFHIGHDSSISIANNGRVQCVLELERWFGIRHFVAKDHEFNQKWFRALRVVRDHCECEEGACPGEFEHGVVVVPRNMDRPLNELQFPKLVESIFGVRLWRHVNHHEAHALLGYYASPFRTALVVSMHGYGNDGPVSAFFGSGSNLYRIANLVHTFGIRYNWLQLLFPEVSGLDGKRHLQMCSLMKTLPASDTHAFFSHDFDSPSFKSFPGKFMGYSGIGEPDFKMRPWIQDYFQHEISLGECEPEKMEPKYLKELLWTSCNGTESQRSLAASMQFEFTQLVQAMVKALLDFVNVHEKIEGIVLTGGSFLNVLVNQQIRERLTMPNSFGKPFDVYVPPAPSDAGLAVGAVWAVQTPHMRQPLQYMGFGLWDKHLLEHEARTRGAQRLSLLGGVDYLADLLVNGHPWLNGSHRATHRPVIAVVRGRQEFGPRALGHRSLLAVPSLEMPKRLNTLKFREWWRPCAPMIADEALVQVFGHKYTSPYMEMAPHVRTDVLERFPGLAHLDGTARHQSVGARDEPWVHSLLLKVGEKTGLAALINTSFNSKGKPIVNTVVESLHMLDEHEDLDYVLIEDWLFRASSRQHGSSV